MTFFCTWRAAFRKWFFGFPAVFHSVHMEPIFPSSGSFPWISNVCFSCHIQLIRKLLLSLSVIFIQQCLQFVIFKLFRWFSTFFISHVKIATFEFFKSLKTLWFTKSMLTVASMRFCSSFLQMITENQCCLQIIVSRHKIRHVQRYYKLYCCVKLVLLWVENLSLRCQNKEMSSMAPSDGNYIDSYDHLLIHSGFIFTYLVHNISEKTAVTESNK